MAANTNREDILTPTGRFVQGSLYTPNTTDMEGRPLVYKSGEKQGQPRVEYYMAIAVPKKGETHWAHTEWGAKIWAVAHKGFPNGQTNSPKFAWKIEDGDSLVPNTKGTVPANCDGFPGNWILRFKSSEAPSLLKLNAQNKTESFNEKDGIKPGDYIQISGHVSDNQSQQQPGVFLNPKFICFRGYGDRIILGVDPDSVGFGSDALPTGASSIPVGGFATPSPVAPLLNTIPTPAPLLNTVAAPYSNILVPPVPAPALASVPAPVAPRVRVMTAKAEGRTYEQYITAGWDDKMLVQHGIMEA